VDSDCNEHIEHGAMSSLWLVADKHRKMRVDRQQ
jgi:hypothetical protein